MELILNNCIFSLLIDEFPDLTYEERSRQFSEGRIGIYKKYKEQIIKQHQEYADFCNAEYIHFFNPKEFRTFLETIQYDFIRFYDAIQYFKIYLAYQLVEKYEKVLYLDMDVLIGDIKENAFDEFFGEHIFIKRQTFKKNTFTYYKGVSSRHLKAHLTSKLTGNDANHYNTGIFGCTKESLEHVDFFGNLDVVLTKLNSLNEDHVRYSNEIIMGYCIEENNVRIINQGYDNGEDKIWHKKANGDNDHNCVFLHATGKSWIPYILEKDKLNILCVKWGKKYSAQYVTNLYKSVEQNINIPFNFWCLTDEDIDYHTNVQNIIIPHSSNLLGWWNKLLLFRKGFMHGPCLFFDLDVVIQNNIECFISKDPGLTKIKAYWKDPGILEKPEEIRNRNTDNNSSILSWNGDDPKIHEIWNLFEEDREYFLNLYWGIDRFIDWELPDVVSTYPKNIVYSYREGAEWNIDNEPFKYRPEYSVCIFHQEPNITDCLDHEVVKRFWIK